MTGSNIKCTVTRIYYKPNELYLLSKEASILHKITVLPPHTATALISLLYRQFKTLVAAKPVGARSEPLIIPPSSPPPNLYSNPTSYLICISLFAATIDLKIRCLFFGPNNYPTLVLK
ncbi:hypothetical protein QVD17_02319 [Tagetes erecta]|uniref:Uncharacterized protein n=1 Tax=Tagetes erecta TaxID=13708 RepID=A0AAD8LBF5_TARER|nr:hypothetical protein QVD17_02319 [Tagetes erecta]